MSKKAFLMAVFCFMVPMLASAQTAPTQKTYTVHEGNSLSRIARKVWSNGRLYMEIAKANPEVKAPDYVIHPGQELVIPELANRVAKAELLHDAPVKVASVKPVVVNIPVPTPKVSLTPFSGITSAAVPPPARLKAAPPVKLPAKIDDSFDLVAVPNKDVAFKHDHDHGMELAELFSPPTVGDDVPKFLRPFIGLYKRLTGRGHAPDEIVMVLTGYDPDYECTGKSPGDRYYGITSMGRNAFIADGIATDYGMLPPGSVVDIPGVGVRTVDDTGYTMRQAALHDVIWGDVRFPTHQEARAFGARTVIVKVLRRKI